jgi:glyoxylase-like metal-dependent hydrolase (beta-lactamase superfamily II)
MADSAAATRYRWRLLRAGPIKLDGGGMFGIIPRAIWSRLVTPDEQGRIPLAHNCLLLESPAGQRILIESGSGNKLDAKSKAIYGLSDYTVIDALREIDCDCRQIVHAIVTHLHFDHAGGLTRFSGEGRRDGRADGRAVEPSFPNATIHVQRGEWEDALINRSVMTRTYLPENLNPIEPRLRLLASPPPFPPGYVPRRDEEPQSQAAQRQTEILPGIFALRVPGHTWGQQAICFTDERGRKIVFTPDVMPTVHHLGAAYNLAYDVEPFISTVTRRWFLRAAAQNDWLLVLNHEPGDPLRRVREDGKGWFKLELEP